jgi:radical SAM protein with 4Fe4S-binding SPASM domain
VPAPDELTLKEKLEVVNELADAGVVSIAFSGGEPLMHPDFFLIVKEVKRRGMHAAVATNGTLITKSMARRLKEIGINYVEVSLDFIRPEVNDEFRGVPGAWQRTVEGIRNSVQEGLYTAMATTVTKLNIGDVPDLIDFAKRVGVRRFIHFNFIPAGRGREIADLDLSPLERERLLKLLYEKSRTSGIEVLSTAPQYARVVLQESGEYSVTPTHFYIGSGHEWEIQTLAEFIGGCGSGRLYCAIEPNGDVTPCVFIPQFVVGNLREQRFLEIWSRNLIFSAFRNREKLKGACSCCKYKYVCGGCRARSFSCFGDFTAPDVGCVYNQSAWNQLMGFKRADNAHELALAPAIRGR